MRVGGGNPELVLWPLVAEPDELKPSVGIIIDEIAIGRAVGRPRKNPDATVVIASDAKKLLLKDRLETEIAPQHCRRTA
jgi:hypothetical protein